MFENILANWTFCVLPTVFFGPKTIFKVAIIKTNSATITFLCCPSFLLLTLSFSPFISLRYYDFGASRA